METDVKSTEKILAKIANKLSEAQQEIDDLAIQLTQGKAEAKDKFEEIKNDFRSKVSEFKHFLKKSPVGEEVSEVKEKALALEQHLLKGVAETKEGFDLQKRNLLTAVQGLEKAIDKTFATLLEPEYFLHDVEKFKIKLEILRLKFELGRMDVTDEFKKNMDIARTFINEIKERAKGEGNAGKEEYEHFHDELRLAYAHFRKAIREL